MEPDLHPLKQSSQRNMNQSENNSYTFPVKILTLNGTFPNFIDNGKIENE